ncbi:MAG: hypothetical protein KIT83_22440, partial [Bryobacterales bacterium]|nr:hypothetical protein [Bryobacterales bacterium]
MRRRWQRKLRKRLRQRGPSLSALAAIVASPERKHQSVAAALRGIALDPAQGHSVRREAVHLLYRVADRQIVA